jgi:amino acid permease
VDCQLAAHYSKKCEWTPICANSSSTADMSDVQYHCITHKSMGAPAIGSGYSKKVAFVYVFNLVVGVGALALPRAFGQTGLILGTVTLLVLASLALLTVSFVLEAFSMANALGQHAAQGTNKEERVLSDDREDGEGLAYDRPLLTRGETSTLGYDVAKEKMHGVESGGSFSLVQRFEFARLATIFLGEKGKVAFYSVLILYLFGDLSIKAVTVSLSLHRVTGSIPGWTEMNTYRLFVFFFALIVVPFSFFNTESSKLLQFFTITVRNTSFVLMIVLAFVFVGSGSGAEPSEVPLFQPTGIPTLFGVAVYAFMCHHSLPSIIHPITEKRSLLRMFLGDFGLIYSAYILVCWSGVFAFSHQTADTCPNQPGEACKLQPLFSLNFSSYRIHFIAVFLTLFPCFTLTSNFPIMAVTLRNNMLELFFPGDPARQSKFKPLMAVAASIPPLVVALLTQRVDLLVTITGSFAGVGIQYVLPTLFVMFGRKMLVHHGIDDRFNPYKSPISHRWLLWGVLLWSALSFVMSIYNMVLKFSQ